jgi:tRNA1Val (adenine37-N6)-methyltransferase
MFEEENNIFFHFKQFSVRHHQSSFKIGFDGVLLGAWCDVPDANSILDIGTGSGLIALIAAQRNPEAQITGIEPDAASYSDANYNFNNCKWSDRLFLSNDSLMEFKKPNEIRFDHIISNPPFFDNTLPPPDISKKLSRHAVTLSHQDILQYFIENASDNGKLSLILPTKPAEELLVVAEKLELHNSRLTKVITKGATKRILLEFSKNSATETEIKELIVYNEDGSYSSEYLNLVSELYLNLG